MMPDSRHEMQALVLKWLEGRATADEEKQLFDWYNEWPEGDVIVTEPVFGTEEDLRTRMLKRLEETTGTAFLRRGSTPIWKKTGFQIAASVLILVGLCTYYYRGAEMLSSQKKSIVQEKGLENLSPGGNKAILTLANGKTIVLDDISDGTIAKEASVDIVKSNGQVRYVPRSLHDEPAYNTISTPRKGQYHLILSDGSQIWLDAESSIRFPTKFTGPERGVEISGQAYLEVAKNAVQAFHVVVPEKNVDVQVLGTRFNVMSYSNESSVETTLLEGSVKLNTGGTSALLKPGQQARIREKGSIEMVNKANLDQVMAWKNGMFDLGHTPIQEIMRQVARWYDAEIRYEGDISQLQFSGEVSRKKNVSELLEILEATNTVKFKIQGNVITVLGKKQE